MAKWNMFDMNTKLFNPFFELFVQTPRVLSISLNDDVDDGGHYKRVLDKDE